MNVFPTLMRDTMKKLFCKNCSETRSKDDLREYFQKWHEIESLKKPITFDHILDLVSSVICHDSQKFMGNTFKDKNFHISLWKFQ